MCDDCVVSDDCTVENMQRSYHRDETLLSLEEKQMIHIECSSVTKESDIDRHRNHNVNHTKQFAILEAQRQQRVHCLDCEQYIIS